MTMQVIDEQHAVAILDLLNRDRTGKKKLCDVTIQSNGKKHRVHKCIVSVVSHFFAKAFDSEMREKYDCSVTLNTIPNVTINHVIEFIYTGKVQLTKENIVEILEIAEYLQIEGLKLLCKNFLLGLIDAENCLSIRAHAQRYNLDEIREKCDHVIVEFFSDVIQQDHFTELDAQSVKLVLGKKRNSGTEDLAFASLVRWVRHDQAGRRESFTDLFKMINLSLLPDVYLKNVVASTDVVMSIQECRSLVLEAAFKNPPIADEQDRFNFLVVGGLGSEKDCVRYHMANKKQQRLPKLNFSRCGANLVVMNRVVFALGGGEKLSYLENPMSIVEKLDLKRPAVSWKIMADMSVARQYPASSDLNGYLYVSGGANKSGYLSSCEKYDVMTNTWTSIRSMNTSKAFHGMVALDGKLYAVGGCNKDYHLKTTECHDPMAGGWRNVAPLNEARSGLALVTLKGKIYAIGGFNGKNQSTVERYNPETDNWCLLQPLNVARNRAGACVLDKKIVVVGGQDINKVPVKSVEVYDHEEDKWSLTFELESSRYSSALAAI